MTNALTLSASPARPAGFSVSFRPAPETPDRAFVDLLDLADGTPAKALGAVSSAPDTTFGTTTSEEDELPELLDALHALFDTLASRLDSDKTLSSADIDELGQMLGRIETLLSAGTSLPASDGDPSLPDRPGLRPGEAFELLSGLAARLAEGLRDAAPELASRLTDLTRQLDAHAATIQTAAAETKASAAITMRHVESETRLNPAAAIDAAATDTVDPETPAPERKTFEPAPASSRSLVGSDASAPAASPSARSGANTTAPAASAATPAELEAPDGLITQPAGPHTQSPGAITAPRPEAALYQRPEVQVNLPHIAAEISRHVHNGTTRFEIRLNPAELGRIDVRMEMDQSGNVIARLAVERSETLDLLQRDQRALMRALADAGMDTARTDLQFSLDQDGRQGFSRDEDGARHAVRFAAPGADAAPSADTAAPVRGYARLDAVNLWV
ncbi:flagellar hook-length control protein FliK [Pelagibacterium lacus]|uniref:Flagellar hook-length control protein FliK n=1 Tax=Pelagibacterium lacus TaxID=2282655 RepID=A0A369W2P3_9HYPH|nr:flagellar hook-length control protein FliK [Pelagibacterium lacus]RDE08237.1 flagellar hook-length control protein FliK [Pelagibacterium lacus]